ncbi:MAG: hypothetical protein JWQ44_1727 [Chthoniobacter sp.]|jgi:hypothetical protein|nr:hypothetical protein [Chthoniobacter sp.]
MSLSLRISLLPCILLLAFGLAEVKAESSLYNPRDARSLTPEETSVFGPKASKFRYDSRMIRAAQIAQDRARPRSTSKCWRFVKQALLAAGVVDSYPKTVYAKQAAQELPKSYGFKKLRTMDPYKAPIGGVIVYGGRDAGHIEIRTAHGFVSDFTATRPYLKRPVIGIFVKPRV